MQDEGTSLMEPTGAAPLRPTDLREIGPYRLLGRLGEGGMGTVFLAKAPTGRFVAVKVVKAEFANQEGFAIRFHAEVDSARRVASFCTAQVLDNGNTGDNRPYMVTEYIAGTPLSDQIVKYGALDPGPLHGVALGVAAALAAIHVAGLVHRDLKPANVILSLSGPRVIDFGIARALDRETGFTLSGELLGSPGWWAPEQVRGEQVSPAADIFAWGCLMAYAGNGRHPYGRGDPITLASRVLHAPPDLGALPAPLNDLVRRATEMDASLRPTAQELLLALVGAGAPAARPGVEAQAARPVDPPTLVANDLMTTWKPPQNVVDSPDITAAFATPPPSDTQNREEGRAAWEEQAAREELARWAVPTPPPVQRRQEDTEPPQASRTSGTRWLFAAAAAVLAIAVTAGVLIVTSTRNNPHPTQATQAQAKEQEHPNDLGRHFPLSKDFDGPNVIIAGAPECGLKEYQGTAQTQGQLCLLRWTMLNPGGVRTQLGTPTLTLIDDRNGRHDPLSVSTQLPDNIVPGGRIDGVFVFDLQPARKPARLSGTMLTNGQQIEVRL